MRLRLDLLGTVTNIEPTLLAAIAGHLYWSAGGVAQGVVLPWSMAFRSSSSSAPEVHYRGCRDGEVIAVDCGGFLGFA